MATPSLTRIRVSLSHSSPTKLLRDDGCDCRFPATKARWWKRRSVLKNAVQMWCWSRCVKLPWFVRVSSPMAHGGSNSTLQWRGGDSCALVVVELLVREAHGGGTARWCRMFQWMHIRIRLAGAVVLRWLFSDGEVQGFTVMQSGSWPAWCCSWWMVVAEQWLPASMDDGGSHAARGEIRVSHGRDGR
ncbi:hypothetical protein DEO72_LG1g2810 [Vigna unguiculata]|uniref:Uncharacterized protein n=1 Tax=Vigna unguiculata TaxID=3917 RepID=A0A4D6KXB6_VIGUN|nr:hypothetical protein DEO72_LG1g2810 [Vigna unguiculata]